MATKWAPGKRKNVKTRLTRGQIIGIVIALLMTAAMVVPLVLSALGYGSGYTGF